jgi:DNA-binding protein Fis
MKRVIVQILPADNRSPEHAAGVANELALESALIPINGASRPPVVKDLDDDAGVRLEAVISAERARTIVDAVLNVNELANVDSFDRMVDLLIQRELASDDSGQLFHRVMSSVEKALVEKAYVECGQVQTRTAERLGVNRNTIHKKLLKHELLDPEDDELDVPPDVLIEKRKCV